MAARNGPKARTEIIDMLKEDHKKVKKAFTDFEKLSADDTEQCEAIVERTCAELEVHAAIEEELFYPAVREAIEQTDLIDEAEVEHQSLKMLIEQLKTLDADDEKYAASFTVLGEYVKHHVREEESEIFELLPRAKVDWEKLQQEMMRRRQEMMASMGLEEAAESH